MHTLKYIEMLNDGIDYLIKKETENGKLSPEKEKMLHTLLENRKHINEYIKEKSTSHNMPMGNTENSYFGS